MSVHSKTTFFFGALTAIVAVYAATILFVPSPAQADLIPACSATGACGFCDMVNVFITLGRWLVTGGAGLGLLLIIWAGVGLATSGGNPEKISASKKQIGGVIVGLGMVLVAFQFVTILIAFVVTPSEYGSFDGSRSKEAAKIGSLTEFLGVPWWTICSENDLRQYQGNRPSKDSTADCRFWGDGTVCQPLTPDQEKQLSEQLKKGETPSNVKRCCAGKCEAGECAMAARLESGVNQPPLPCAGQTCGTCDPQLDQRTRNVLTSYGIAVNKGMCPGETRYQDKPGGCTTVGGLPDSTVDRLKRLKDLCGNFMLNGGTECGHSSHGFGRPIVDIDFDPSFALCLKSYIGDLNVIRICTTSGDRRSYGFNCPTYDEAVRHLHVEFRL